MYRPFMKRSVAVVVAAGFLLTAGCPAKVNAPKGVGPAPVASASLEMRSDVKEQSESLLIASTPNQGTHETLMPHACR